MLKSGKIVHDLFWAEIFNANFLGKRCEVLIFLFGLSPWVRVTGFT